MNSTRTRSRSPAVMAPRTPAVKGVSKRSKQKKPVLLTAYLVLYNLCSAAAWAHFALALLHAVSAAQWDISAAGPQKETARLLLWVQSAAVLEIAHAALGLVPSQLLSTTMQICSRLFIVGLAQYTTRPESRWSYALFATAWLLSDLTRYCYYVANLLSLSPAILVWARYSLFLVLYPLGTLGEASLVASTAYQLFLLGSLRLAYPLIAVIALYPFGFSFMFRHMLHQRKKYLANPKSKSS